MESVKLGKSSFFVIFTTISILVKINNNFCNMNGEFKMF